jgi:hypothetical protein
VIGFKIGADCKYKEAQELEYNVDQGVNIEKNLAIKIRGNLPNKTMRNCQEIKPLI